MASAVATCNRALAMIGAAPILSLEDGSTKAKLCAQHYAPLRDELQQGHRWHFARKKVSLPESSTAPLFGYTHAYPLPADCLRVLWIHDEDFPLHGWTREGNAIHTSIGAPLQAEIIHRVTDENLFPANFIAAHVAALARDLAMPVSQDQTQRDKAAQALQVALILARGVDIQEERRPATRFSFTDVRY